MTLRISPDVARLSRSLFSIGLIIAVGMTLSACVGAGRFGGGSAQAGGGVANIADRYCITRLAAL